MRKPTLQAGSIQEARLIRKLTYQEAAKKVGVTVAVWRGLEDQVFPPTPEEARAIERHLRVRLPGPVQGDLF